MSDPKHQARGQALEGIATRLDEIIEMVEEGVYDYDAMMWRLRGLSTDIRLMVKRTA